MMDQIFFHFIMAVVQKIILLFFQLEDHAAEGTVHMGIQIQINIAAQYFHRQLCLIGMYVETDIFCSGIFRDGTAQGMVGVAWGNGGSMQVKDNPVV